jgi:hypothetical protein
MNIPIFPKKPDLEGIWWHRLAGDLTVAIFYLSVLLSFILFAYYITQVKESERIKSISEQIEISTYIRRQPGKEKMHLEELGKEIKNQNPDYADLSNSDLALATIYKYPSYRNYINYNFAYLMPDTGLLKTIIFLLISGFFLPSLIYRLFLRLLNR